MFYQNAFQLLIVCVIYGTSFSDNARFDLAHGQKHVQSSFIKITRTNLCSSRASSCRGTGTYNVLQQGSQAVRF